MGSPLPGDVPTTNGQVLSADAATTQANDLKQQMAQIQSQIDEQTKQYGPISSGLKTAITQQVNQFNTMVYGSASANAPNAEEAVILGQITQLQGGIQNAIDTAYRTYSSLADTITQLTQQYGTLKSQADTPMPSVTPTPTPSPIPADPSTPTPTPTGPPTPTPTGPVTPTPTDPTGTGSVQPASNSVVPSSGSGSGLGGMSPLMNGLGGMNPYGQNPYGQNPYGQGVYPQTQPAAAAAAPSTTPAAQPATASTNSGKPGAGTGKGTDDKAVAGDGSANGQHKDGTNNQTANKQPGADGMIVYTFKDGKTQKVPPVVAQALTKAEADNDHTDAQGNYADSTAKWQKDKDPGVRVDPSKLVTGDVAKWDHWTAIVRALPENSGVGVTGVPPDVIVDGKWVAFTGDDMQGKAGASGPFDGFFHPPAIGTAHQDATADPATGGAVPVAPSDPGDHHPAVSAPSPAVISG